jgi:pimeloyl-ACP methyl ester carboxylesterase
VRLGSVPALVGGAAGLLGAAAVAGIAQQRRTAVRERARIEPAAAAALGSWTADWSATVQTDDGLSLHTEQIGPLDAELTVLFVHGFTLNLRSFHFQRHALATAFGDRVRQLYYDQRSHGRSAESPSEGCTIEQLGRDLYSVLDRLAPSGPVVLVGHSMGGMTVMALADQHPELFGDGGRVRAVALVNTSPGDLRTITLGLPSALARFHAPLLPYVLRRAARNAALVERGRALGRDLAWVVTKRLSFADPAVDPAVVEFAARMIEATPVNVVAGFYPTLIAHDGRQALQNLRCPVLVIGADSDALTPVSHSERIAHALPHAQLIIAANSGHLLMLEHPDQVNLPLVTLVQAAMAPARPGSAAPAPVSPR